MVSLFDRQWGWKQLELLVIVTYAIGFYAYVVQRSLQLSRDHEGLYGLRDGWLFPPSLNDVSDAQWGNFRGNLGILTIVFASFTLVAYIMKAWLNLKARGMSTIWLLISLIFLTYLHGVYILFILVIASLNFLLVKLFARKRYFLSMLWSFNLFFLELWGASVGYMLSLIRSLFPIAHRAQWAFLDDFHGTFRWHICFNFVVLRMISYGSDYHWAHEDLLHFDQEKHTQRCPICKSGKSCYQLLQERNVNDENFVFTTYLCYLVYAPLYIAGPIISFNAFASQLAVPQNHNSVMYIIQYGMRWVFSLALIELMTHLFHYNALAISGSWKQLSPMDVFIIGYGVLNFMWLKFLLIWRYFRFWSLVAGIEAPENMPKCVNNCYNLESFWKNWHASFNKWIVRYMYIPLGGSRRKLINIWPVFTFVAIWHDLEWKLLSWAWLTCLFYIPEMIVKSATNAFQVETASGRFIFRELHAAAGAVTITCLMFANLVGFVIGPSGIHWLIHQLLSKEGLPVLGFMLFTFYMGTKLMFHIQEAKQRN